MHDLLDIYTMGSDALKAIGTKQTDKMDFMQAMQRQMRMTNAAMNASNTIKGLYGSRLLMEVEKRKREMEERDGFPLSVKEKED